MRTIRQRFEGAPFFLVMLTVFLLLVFGTNANLGAENTGPLKIALLPILDSFPYFVAESNDYFRSHGVDVKVIPVASAVERDQLMQSGEIDGMLNEMMSTASFNRDQVMVKIIAAARMAYPDYPLFRVLAAPGSGLDTPRKLAGIAVGVSRNTIIEYVTDRLLEAEHLKPEDIKNISVPVIPERFQLLMQGQLSAATLPDPMAKSAMAAGAVLVIDDAKYPQFAVSVLSFGIQSLGRRPVEVRNFLKAWDQAVADIDARPENYRDLLLKKIRVPKNIQDTFKIPPYPRKTVPDGEQWADVMAWMVSKKLLKHPLPYQPSVTSAFLPE